MPEVIFEDNHLLVINKPAGMLVQGDDTADESLFDWAKQYIKVKYNKPGDVFLGLIHRLDRPVSGIVCFARTSKAASRISEQFRGRTTSKTYHAVVEGMMNSKNAHLKNWLIINKGSTKNSSTIALNKKPNAKRAELKYKCIGMKDSRSLLEIELLTGYKHQIRAQLAFLGNPIVGDFRYSEKTVKPERIDGGHAILLHARTLTINHPTLKDPISFTAPYPKYFPTF